ncbi:UNVERIFIED_CONTAM: WAT1-related protein [Sesamum radiatum]|uniref:WAT1-related protein n=1 Tax=Sesamum radiatum TaxID=300843 RepID=A0AAW2P4T3_SESRA
MGSGFAIMVNTWGLHMKGPVYVAMFRPLSIAIAAIMGVIFLGDDLYLGSVIGSIVITMGFYTVMWGKTKEEIVETSMMTKITRSHILPAMRSYLF